MPQSAPNPEHVARVWELFCEQRTLREIAEIMKTSPSDGGRSISISHETVRQWVLKAREAEAWLVAKTEVEKADERETMKARYLGFLERLAAAGFDRMSPRGGGTYEQVAPILLKIGQETAKVLEIHAPVRVRVEGSVLAPALDPQTAAIVAAMEQAREQATATGRALLSGDGDSP